MNVGRTILVVDDDPDVQTAVRLDLENIYPLIEAKTGAEALVKVADPDVAAVLLDITLSPGDPEDGISLIPKLLLTRPKLPIVMLSAHRSTDMVSEALKRGARDYVPKPFDTADLLSTIKRTCPDLSTRQERPTNDAAIEDRKVDFIGRSVVARKIRKQASKASLSDANVLISGASGSGKEVVARLIHAGNGNSKRPFVAVNCAAIPANLIESMLFGHEKGAFTGAVERRIGKFEQADGGDIFLDEINAMPTDLQAKLLRAIQEQEFERVGGTQTIRSKFRVIAASNEDLLTLVRKGRFREDLYYRLCVIEIAIPPLKDRVEDIPLLINHYLEMSPRNKTKKTISAEARGALAAITWPGNVRQLFNVLDGMLCLSERREMKVEDIPQHLLRQASTEAQDEIEALPLAEFTRAMERYEERWLERALRETNGSQIRAAELLGITRQSFIYRLKRLRTAL